mmetsp:Transcript_83135/g.240605  ORF Transcript_83135/g.240605 Transcript_83135/m.240605 type:complete len:103 (+) Transcript_83135:535-843(+)
MLPLCLYKFPMLFGVLRQRECRILSLLFSFPVSQGSFTSIIFFFCQFKFLHQRYIFVLPTATPRVRIQVNAMHFQSVMFNAKISEFEVVFDRRRDFRQNLPG